MIKENVNNLLREIPEAVNLVVATKERSVAQIKEAISAGAKTIGENYVLEARDKFTLIGKSVNWHLIGHLQKNKVKYAVTIFDMIETLDSCGLAEVLDRECKKINKIMPVLIEVNSASEPQKNGVLIENVESFIKELSQFGNLKFSGLMTMGPWLDDGEQIRPYFRRTKELYDKIRIDSDLKYLSMGMSDSYRIAIEEGANIIRVGTAIFGERVRNK